MKAIVDYFKSNAKDGWGVVSKRQMMKDILCGIEEIKQVVIELQNRGWQFEYRVVTIGGLDYEIIEFEIN